MFNTVRNHSTYAVTGTIIAVAMSAMYYTLSLAVHVGAAAQGAR